MSKGDSGLFSDTKGNQKQSTATASVPKQFYRVTDELRDHIENEHGYSKRNGIIGAHRESSFYEALEKYGGKIEEIKFNSQLIGVKNIRYRLPKKDMAGNPTTEFQSKIYRKTVYDHKVLKTRDYLKWGIEAANEALKRSEKGRLSRVWEGQDKQGKHWIGNSDVLGHITTMYPDD